MCFNFGALLLFNKQCLSSRTVNQRVATRTLFQFTTKPPDSLNRTAPSLRPVGCKARFTAKPDYPLTFSVRRSLLSAGSASLAVPYSNTARHRSPAPVRSGLTSDPRGIVCSDFNEITRRALSNGL